MARVNQASCQNLVSPAAFGGTRSFLDWHRARHMASSRQRSDWHPPCPPLRRGGRGWRAGRGDRILDTRSSLILAVQRGKGNGEAGACAVSLLREVVW